jgi:hypothetical protein
MGWIDGRNLLIDQRAGLGNSEDLRRYAVELEETTAWAPQLRPSETELRGWAYETRTAESVRELSNWSCVTNSSEVGESPAAQTLACELRDTDLQLRPRFSRRSLTRREAL